HIGKKLDYYKFPLFQNPLGILFHPVAIENVIVRACKQEEVTEEALGFQNEHWYCFDAHSDLNSVSKTDLLTRVNRGLEATYQHIASASHIIITLGTAWVYRFTKTGALVANCHKVPQKEFSKELLSSNAVAKSLKNSLHQIKSINPNATVIFTVSPVRHLKDGFVENQRSKAHVISAVHQTINAHNASYFPSYEIMMDELRDYRFYETDMIHPNTLAIDYIWEKFRNVWIAEGAYPAMDQVASVQKDLGHKAFHSQSQQHQKFLKSLAKKITYLKETYPFMQFDE
ncbi:MAG: GSCFA domain-containing protein, partial [Bacteroidota bacterium]